MLMKRLMMFLLTREEVENNLIKIVKRYVPTEINPNATFEDLGLTSFDVLEIIALLENDANVDLKIDDVMSLKNISETINLVVKASENPAPSSED